MILLRVSIYPPFPQATSRHEPPYPVANSGEVLIGVVLVGNNPGGASRTYSNPQASMLFKRRRTRSAEAWSEAESAEHPERGARRAPRRCTAPWGAIRRGTRRRSRLLIPSSPYSLLVGNYGALRKILRSGIRSCRGLRDPDEGPTRYRRKRRYRNRGC